jgi:N-acetyl-D-muramate 6-phosphate phosphatase
MTLRAVLFDLDGTLLDTAPDLAAALNELRREQSLPALDFGAIRPLVSHGAAAVVRLGFPHATEEQFSLLRERFLQLYSASLAIHTRLFPGFEPVLAVLESRQLKWGVVTNKPAFLTQPLLAQLGLSARCASIVSGDTLPQRKPHPAPLLHAASLMGVDPAECIYVGDAERDIQAAHAAGMRAFVATFGYLGVDDDPVRWRPEAMIAAPQELLRWLNGSA